MMNRGSDDMSALNAFPAAEIAVFKSHDPLFTQVYQWQIDRGKHHLVALTHVAPPYSYAVDAVAQKVFTKIRLQRLD